jgi:endo-1,4-beta-xylanase
MINRKLITSFFIIVAIAVSAYGQDNTKTVSQKTLKEAYAGKFFIGAANDLNSISEVEAANIKTQYDIITPENCMKPQPIHPSEDVYNFVTTDAMVDWCQKNGLKVWGHTLVWHSQSGPWFFQEKNTATGEAAQPVTPPAPPPATAVDANAPRPNTAGPGGRGNTGPQASREVVLERLKAHIMTVVGRYKGRIVGWDVVNE